MAPPPTLPADSDDQLAGVSAENCEIIMRQAGALKGEARAQGEANANPLPGPLGQVFEPGEAIGGLRVRKLVHYDFVLLKRMKSPLLEQLVRKKGKAGAAFTDEQGYEMIYQFTRPCEEVEAALNKHGVAGYRALAKREIGLKLGPLEAILLVKAVEEEFLRAFSTCIRHGAPEKEGGGETVFTGPAMTPAARTG